MVLTGECLTKKNITDVHKIRLDGSRGKGTAKSFCDPGWCVHKSDVQNKWDDITHRERDFSNIFLITQQNESRKQKGTLILINFGQPLSYYIIQYKYI